MSSMKLRTKLFIPLIIFCVAFVGYAHFFWFDKYISSYIESHETDVNAHLMTVAAGLAPLMLESNNQADKLGTLFDNLDVLLERHPQWLALTLSDAEQNVLYPLKAPPRIVSSESVHFYNYPITASGDVIGSLRLDIDFSDTIATAARIEKYFQVALLSLLFIAIVTIVVTVEFVVNRPIRVLSDVSKQISAGDFSGEFPNEAHGEIGELIHNFEDMRDSIVAHYSQLMSEIESHKKTASELLAQKELTSYQASHDALTGLINRREFERRVNLAIACSRTDNSRHVLLYIDLDQFKIVNDTCGYIAGDMLLRRLSELLRSKTREHDTLSRLGGDEFGLLFEYCHVEDGLEISRGLLDAVKTFRFSWEDKVFSIGASIGLVEFSAGSRSYVDILSAADAACYTAKEQGRNRIKVYQSEDADLSRRKGEMLWATDLVQALEQNRLMLFCQQITPLNGVIHAHKHYEILLRVKTDNGTIIYPAEFIPAAERYNLRVFRKNCGLILAPEASPLYEIALFQAFHAP